MTSLRTMWGIDLEYVEESFEKGRIRLCGKSFREIQRLWFDEAWKKFPGSDKPGKIDFGQYYFWIYDAGQRLIIFLKSIKFVRPIMLLSR